MASVRQIRANRLNALQSTEPTTEVGKGQSRQNALKHGLAGAGVVLPEAEAQAVAARRDAWRESFRPATPYDEWLVEQMARESVRIDRCHHLEESLRVRQADRAAVSWDDDRRLDAEATAARLARKPTLVSRQLQQTAQGCDWLIERWEGLGRLLDDGKGWDESRRALALDLLGTPAEFRDATTRLDPPPGGDPLATLRAVVGAEVERLAGLKSGSRDDLDAAARDDAESGLSAEPDRAIVRVLRYEAECGRRLDRARAQLQTGRRDPAPLAPAPPPSRPTVLPSPPAGSPKERDRVALPPAPVGRSGLEGLSLTALVLGTRSPDGTPPPNGAARLGTSGKGPR